MPLEFSPEFSAEVFSATYESSTETVDEFSAEFSNEFPATAETIPEPDPVPVPVAEVEFLGGFRALRENTIANVHLSPDGFAEVFTYTPKATGTPRSVTGHIEEEIGYDWNGYTETRQDQLVVMCLRDEANAERGGIADPEIGDIVTRSAAVDPLGTPYIYRGEEARDVKSYKWRLVFERHQRVAEGVT